MPTSACSLKRSPPQGFFAAGAFALVLMSGSALRAAPKATPGASPAHASTSSAKPTPIQASSPPKAPETSQAQALKDRARLGLQADELPETLSALRALAALEPSVTTTCNLGLVARRLGSSVEAAENLTRCVMAYSLVPPDDAERAHVEEIAAELAMARAAVAVVSMKVPPKAIVMIDGKPLGIVDAAREYFLEPGLHSFSATLGTVTTGERVQLARGAVRTVELLPARTAPMARKRDVLPVIGWLATAGAATFGGAMLVVSAANADVAADELRDAETAPGGCFHAGSASERCSGFVKAERWAGTFSDLAVGSFIAAGALAIGTTIYMVHGSASSPRAVVGSNFIKVVVPW